MNNENVLASKPHLRGHAIIITLLVFAACLIDIFRHMSAHAHARFVLDTHLGLSFENNHSARSQIHMDFP